jgi:hypothetical protein
VRLVLCAGGDPLAEDLLLLRRESAGGITVSGSSLKIRAMSSLSSGEPGAIAPNSTAASR